MFRYLSELNLLDDGLERVGGDVELFHLFVGKARGDAALDLAVGLLEFPDALPVLKIHTVQSVPVFPLRGLLPE